MSVIVAPGKIIIEYLEDNNIDVDEFFESLNYLPKDIRALYGGEGRLTKELLLALEKSLPSISSTYWMNLEEKYLDNIKNEYEGVSIDFNRLGELAKKFKFDEIFDGLGWTRVRKACEMLKMLDIKTYDEFYSKYNDIAVNFMEDGGTIESIVVWLKSCEEEIEFQDNDLRNNTFNKQKLLDSIDKFKKLAYIENEQGIKRNCRKLCNRLGINLVINSPITNAKVRGALTTVDGNPTIYISGRFKTHDHVWFAFMHELGHLIYHYEVNETLISYEDEEDDIKEIEANNFARDILIDKNEYDKFTSERGYLSRGKVLAFAKAQNVLPGIVVGRLQHDNFIAMSALNDLKIKFESL